MKPWTFNLFVLVGTVCSVSKPSKSALSLPEKYSCSLKTVIQSSPDARISLSRLNSKFLQVILHMTWSQAPTLTPQSCRSAQLTPCFNQQLYFSVPFHPAVLHLDALVTFYPRLCLPAPPHLPHLTDSSDSHVK